MTKHDIKPITELNNDIIHASTRQHKNYFFKKQRKSTEHHTTHLENITQQKDAITQYNSNMIRLKNHEHIHTDWPVIETHNKILVTQNDIIKNQNELFSKKANI